MHLADYVLNSSELPPAVGVPTCPGVPRRARLCDMVWLQDSGEQEWRQRGEGMEAGRVGRGRRRWETTFCYPLAGLGPHFTEQETEVWSGPEGTLVHGVQNSAEAQPQSLASRSNPGEGAVALLSPGILPPSLPWTLGGRGQLSRHPKDISASKAPSAHLL